MLTRDQMKDGRALLGWSARELAERAGIRPETVYRLESGALDLEKTALGTVRKLRNALEAGGIEFLADGSVRRRGPVRAEKVEEDSEEAEERRKIAVQIALGHSKNSDKPSQK